jgi:hypothetical protein
MKTNLAAQAGWLAATLTLPGSHLAHTHMDGKVGGKTRAMDGKADGRTRAMRGFEAALEMCLTLAVFAGILWCIGLERMRSWAGDTLPSGNNRVCADSAGGM